MLVLDDSQQAAAHSPASVARVTAPAGSGKTATLIARVLAWLDRDDIAPEHIVLATFTRRAAGEMQARLAEEGAPSEVRVGTIASLMLRAVIAAAALRGSRAPRIIPPEDAFLRFRAIAKALGASWEGDTLQEAWDATLKAARLNAADVLPTETHRQVHRAFLEHLAGARQILFEHLPALALEAVQMPGVREALNVRALAVDEWQDTEPDEFAFLKRLEPDRLFVVGDPYQSIYGWRGVNVRYLDTVFRRTYPRAVPYMLTTTYRFGEQIAKAAVAVLPESALRQAQISKGDPGRVVLQETTTPFHEAAWVADQVNALITAGVDPREIAVLMRTHAQRVVVEQAFADRRIPYMPLGDDQPLYSRLVSKQLAAYIALILTLQGSNYDFNGAFDLALQAPPRGIGPRSMNLLRGEKGYISWGDIGAAPQMPGLPPGAREAAAAFMEELEEMAAAANGKKPSQILGDLIGRTGWKAHLGDFPDGTRDIQALDTLLEESSRFDSLEAFFLHLRDRMKGVLVGDGVSMGTLHAAKGLEWAHVFVIGLNQGMLPFRSALDDPDALEEERRLLHVGITRAREAFYGSWAKGQDSPTGMIPLQPSPFLAPLARQAEIAYA